tara:strand:- start:156 stop:599 length:444 start_codon:yes stop_codon:yes gene_type:complete
MKQSLFDKIFVGYAEYNFFNTLCGVEKVQYIFEIFDIEIKRNGQETLINGLSEFFDDISEDADHGVEFDTYDVGNDKTRVDVMIDSENIVVESNSLKAVRFMARKFMDNGYLISRDKQVEKIFRKNKVTRYLRVYKIIGQHDELCYN